MREGIWVLGVRVWGLGFRMRARIAFTVNLKCVGVRDQEVELGEETFGIQKEKSNGFT